MSSSPKQHPGAFRQIAITCPATGEAVLTGVSMSAEMLAEATKANLRYSMRCPACAEGHLWSPADAHLADR